MLSGVFMLFPFAFEGRFLKYLGAYQISNTFPLHQKLNISNMNFKYFDICE